MIVSAYSWFCIYSPSLSINTHLLLLGRHRTERKELKLSSSPRELKKKQTSSQHRYDFFFSSAGSCHLVLVSSDYFFLQLQLRSGGQIQHILKWEGSFPDLRRLQMRSSVLRKPQTTAGNSREIKQAKEQKGKNSNFPKITEKKTKDKQNKKK